MSDRAARIATSGSPLMEQARQEGLTHAASRGLLSSSLAAQAAQEAVVSRAGALAGADVTAEQVAEKQTADIRYQQQTIQNEVARLKVLRDQAKTEQERLDIDAMQARATLTSNVIAEANKAYAMEVTGIMQLQEMDAEDRKRLLADAETRRRQSIQDAFNGISAVAKGFQWGGTR